jgi:peptide/nickel transport system substrate-binding protein
LKKLGLTLLVLLLTSFLLFGCSKATIDSQGPDSKAKSDSTIVYGLSNSWGSLNPYHIVNYTGTTVHDKLWETLYSIDEDGNLINRSCESYEVKDGGTTFVIHLRHDVCWHDGEPVTAHDWEFAARMIADPAVVGLSGKTYLANLTGIDKSGNIDETEKFGLIALDDYTLQFSLDAPYNYELFMLNFNRHYHPLPKHILGDTDPADFVQSAFWLNPVGCGPFKFVTGIPGEEVVMVANKDFYYDVKFDNLIIKLVSASNVVSALLSGEIDVYSSVQLEDIDLLSKEDSITLYKAHQTEYLYCHVDNRQCNQQVRQAINLAIDKQLIIDEVLNGEGIPGEVAISPESPYFNVEITSGRDIEKAKELLANTNWDSSTVIKMATPSDFREDVAAIMQQNLAEVGVILELTSCDQTAMQAGLKDGTYNMGMQQWGMHYMNPTYFQICQTPGSSINLSFIDHPGYLNLTTAIDSCQDKDELHDLVQDYITYMATDLGHIGIAHKNMYSAWGPKVRNGPTALSHDLVWEWELAN